MYSPHRPRRGGGGGPGTPRSPRTAVPTRGLLLDGIWRCNCPERPPALKLQTKNHGVNHGRWCMFLLSLRSFQLVFNLMKSLGRECCSARPSWPGKADT